MNKAYKFSSEVREYAVKLVQERRGEYGSLWPAVDRLRRKSAVYQTLLDWVKREESDGSQRDGLTGF